MPAADLIGVGTGLASAALDAAAARKKNRILTQGTREQSRAGMDATGATASFIDQLRASRPDVAGLTGAYRSAVGAAPTSSLPTASGRFGADLAARTGQAQTYGNDMASLLARINAPQVQRRDEALARGDWGNSLLPIQQGAQNDQFLTQLRAGQVQVNPLAQAGLAFANGAGQYFANRPRFAGPARMAPSSLVDTPTLGSTRGMA